MKRLAPPVLFLLSVAVSADDIYLVGGGKVTGEIVERSATRIVVEVGPGRLTLPMARVLRIQAGRSPLSEFRDRARRLETTDVAGWVALGRWAAERGLETQASEAYQKAIAADPANAEANRGLGRVEMGGRWMSSDDARREQGLVPFEGSWVTPAERDTALRERSQGDLARHREREAEARAREAEANARAAEAEADRAETEAQSSGSSEGIPFVPYLYGGGGGGRPHKHPKPEPTPTPTPAPHHRQEGGTIQVPGKPHPAPKPGALPAPTPTPTPTPAKSKDP